MGTGPNHSTAQAGAKQGGTQDTPACCLSERSGGQFSQGNFNLIDNDSSDEEANDRTPQPLPAFRRPPPSQATQQPLLIAGSCSQPTLKQRTGATSASPRKPMQMSWTFDGTVPKGAPEPTFLDRVIETSLSMHDVSVWQTVLSSSEDSHADSQQLLPHHAPSSSVAAPPAPEKLSTTLYCHVFFAVMKSFVGPAILYLPHALANAGLLLGILALPFIGFLATSSLSLLAVLHIAASDSPTYGDLAQHALGAHGRVAVQAALCAAQLGTCTSYFIFVARNLGDVMLAAGVTVPSDGVLIPALLPVFAPLLFIKSLRSLAVTNILADLLILGGLTFVAVAATTELCQKGPATIEPLVDTDHALLFIGTACFTFEGGALVVPIAASIDPGQKQHFLRIFRDAMIVTVALFTGFGALGYVSFGEDVLMPVTLSVKLDAGTDALLRIGYSVAVVFTYPLQMMPIVQMLEGWCSASTSSLARMPPLVQRFATRLLLLAFTCGAAVLGAEQFDHFISLVGAVCAVPLAFVLPGLIFINLSRELGVQTPRTLWFARGCVSIGVAASLSSGVTSLLSWVQDGAKH